MAALGNISEPSCSSEDEEDNAKLKEAVYEIEMAPKDQEGTDLKTGNDNEIIPSRRPDQQIADTDNFQNTYNTTAGFRRHVSRKLSEALDSEIDCTGQCFCDSSNKAEKPFGVRLFSSSKSLLQEHSPKLESREPVKKRFLPSSSDSSSEDERLAEASVSHNFVLQQSNLPYTTNNKPADIIIRQADQCSSAVTNKNSDDEESEKSEKGEKIKMEQLNKTDEKIDGPVKKHKKKKKKHKKVKME